MVQTSVSMSQKKALAGLPAFAFVPESVSTKAVETAAGLPFGVFAAEGTKTKQCKIVDNVANKILGVAMLTHAIESKTGAVTPNYPQYKDANLLNFGSIWVKTTDANLPAVTGSVYIVVGTADAGKLTNSATNNIDFTLKLVVREVDATLKLALVEFREKI